MIKDVRISECGNGFPGKGNYIPGTDGELYIIVKIRSNIFTGNSAGDSNYILADIKLADWDDVEEEEVFPAYARILRD